MDKKNHWYENKFFNWVFAKKKKQPSAPLTPEQQKELVKLNGGWDEDKLFIPMMTKREAMMRYSTIWKAILFFCLPTIILMVVQTLYNTIDKYLALVFVPDHAVNNSDYIKYMFIGYRGEHISVLLDSLKGVDQSQYGQILEELFDKNATANWADFVNKFDAAFPTKIIDFKFDNNQDKLAALWSAAISDGLVINKTKMAQYVNIATQYTTQSYNIVLAFTKLLAIGAGMHFSVEFGRRNKEKLKEISGNGVTYSFLLSILISFLLFAISFRPWDQILIRSQMGNYKNPIVEQLAWEDVEPLIFGACAIFVGEFVMNMVRSEGKMYHIMIMTIGSVIVNVFFSCILMKFTNLELAGGQIGTVLAYLFEVIYCLLVMFCSKVTYSNFKLRNLWDLKISNLTYSLKAGVPNFINYIAFVIAGYVSTLLVVNIPTPQSWTGGTNGQISILQELISAITPWNDLILGACVGLNQGVRSIIAYNYGAGNNERIVKLLKHSSWLMLGWFMFVFLMIVSVGPYMMELFKFPAQHGAGLNGIAYGNTFYVYLILYFMTYPFACFTYISLGLFQGTARNKVAAFNASLRALTIYVPMTVIGWAVSKATGDPIWYFVFIGLTDFISACIIAPLIYAYYMRAKDENKLVDSNDDEITLATYYKLLISEAKTDSQKSEYTKKYNEMIEAIKKQHSLEMKKR